MAFFPWHFFPIVFSKSSFCRVWSTAFHLQAHVLGRQRKHAFPNPLDTTPELEKPGTAIPLSIVSRKRTFRLWTLPPGEELSAILFKQLSSCRLEVAVALICNHYWQKVEKHFRICQWIKPKFPVKMDQWRALAKFLLSSGEIQRRRLKRGGLSLPSLPQYKVPHKGRLSWLLSGEAVKQQWLVHCVSGNLCQASPQARCQNWDSCLCLRA